MVDTVALSGSWSAAACRSCCSSKAWRGRSPHPAAQCATRPWCLGGLLAVVILKERLQVWHWIAIGLLLIGQAGLSGGFTTSIASGELLILAATLLWAIEVIVAKRLLGSLSSWTVGLARMGFGSVALIGWLLATGSGSAVLTMDAAQWGWVLLTGLILAGYVATWFAALARAQAVDVTAVLVLAALITAGLNAVVNRTPLAPQLGWLLILLAGGTLACVVAWRRAPQELPASPRDRRDRRIVGR